MNRNMLLKSRNLGTKHFNYNITPGEALNIIDKIPKIWDEPFADSSQIPTFMVSKFAREHVTVALSGMVAMSYSWAIISTRFKEIMANKCIIGTTRNKNFKHA